MHSPIDIHIMITPTAPPIYIASLIMSMESSEESSVSVGVTVGGVSVLEVVVVVFVVVGIVTGPVARPTVASLLWCTPMQYYCIITISGYIAT